MADNSAHAILAHLQDQLHAVQAINDTLRASSTLSAVYPVVAEQLARALHFDSFWIGVYEAENDVIRYEYGVDEGVVDDHRTRRVLDNAPLSARVIRARQLQLIDDLLADPIQPTRSWLLDWKRILGQGRCHQGARGVTDAGTGAPAVCPCGETQYWVSPGPGKMRLHNLRRGQRGCRHTRRAD